MRYLGIDLHKKYLVIAEVEDGSKQVRRSRYPLTPDGVQMLKHSIDTNCRIVVEATGNAWWLHDQLYPLVDQVILANPGQLKAIAAARIKTDKVDAEIMARLLAADFIPAVWVPDPLTRRQRSLIGHRLRLRRGTTQCKNRIHAALMRNNVHIPHLFSRQGLAQLAQTELPPEDRVAVDSDLRLLRFTEGEIQALGGELNAEAVEGPRAEQIQLAMSVPGFDVLTASLLVARIGDIRRFPEPDKLASYFGLVPRLHQSGQTNRHGHITKAGSPEARHVLVEAAWAVVRHYKDTPLHAFYERVAARRGPRVAIVALARKLVTILWQVLTRGEACRYARARTLRRKLRRAAKAAVRYPVRPTMEIAQEIAALFNRGDDEGWVAAG